MRVFIVCSIYQLLSAVSIKRAFFAPEKAELLLTFKCDDIQINKIKEIGNFESVLCINEPHQKTKLPILGAFQRIIWRKTFAKKLMSTRQYTHFFTGGLHSQQLLYYGYAFKKNPDLSLSLFDEGMSSYIDIWLEKNGKIDRRDRKSFSLPYKLYLRYCNVTRFSIGQLLKNAEFFYVFSEHLSAGYLPWEIVKIPWEKSSIDAANSIYSVLYNDLSFSDYKKHDVIYLGTYRVGNKAFNDIQKEVADITHEIFGKTMILKPHPGDRIGVYSSGEYTQDIRNFPIELLSLQIDLKNKIFITENSSSLFSLYYLFKQTPYFVLTYKLNQPKDRFVETEESLVRIVGFLESEMGIQDRIFIPKDHDDFVGILSMLKQKLDSK